MAFSIMLQPRYNPLGFPALISPPVF